MSKRYAVLYSDGSFSVTNDGRGLDAAPTWLGYQHSDENAKFVEVEIKVTKIIHDSNPRFTVATEHSATCKTCGTEVFFEPPPPTAGESK